MKKSHWFLIILSAILYATPFLFSDFLWWFIFIFPVPLLYVTRTQNLSFIHGYVWGIFVFLLHLKAGIFIVADLARDVWWIGFAMAIAMVMWQALVPAFLFWSVTKIVESLSLQAPIIRISLWATALASFIFWTDRYCLWIFGMHGYPFMHPLLLLAHQPALLWMLPILGKQLLTIFFLLVSATIVMVLWYKNFYSVLLCIGIIVPWLWGMNQPCCKKQPAWYKQIKSLPCMIRAHSTNGRMNILTRHIKQLITDYPEVSIIVMPESALDKIDHEMICQFGEMYSVQPVHLICGACCYENGNYYNALYWIHNGIVQAQFNKKYTMLLTEHVADWMNVDWLRKIYFKDNSAVTRSCNKRTLLTVSNSVTFVPYICSELFFNEYPDDCYLDTPIIAIVNDTRLIGSYMQELLLLSARFKAIQWQREIVYVSYAHSVFIDKRGMVMEMNT
jgi:hypothetical protein